MRLFVATSFPEAVIRDLNERASSIKSKLPPASWVRPETQHLTFAFLGEQDESLIDKLAPALESHVGGIPKFTATLTTCGFFPNRRRARVGWIGLTPEEPFADIAHAVHDVVTRVGVTLDRADFRPHLTMMRIREHWPPASIDLFERTLRDYKSARFVVDEVTLYSSRLNPNGALHTAVRKFGLAAPSRHSEPR